MLFVSFLGTSSYRVALFLKFDPKLYHHYFIVVHHYMCVPLLPYCFDTVVNLIDVCLRQEHFFFTGMFDDNPNYFIWTINRKIKYINDKRECTIYNK